MARMSYLLKAKSTGPGLARFRVVVVIDGSLENDRFIVFTLPNDGHKILVNEKTNIPKGEAHLYWLRGTPEVPIEIWNAFCDRISQMSEAELAKLLASAQK